MCGGWPDIVGMSQSMPEGLVTRGTQVLCTLVVIVVGAVGEAYWENVFSSNVAETFVSWLLVVTSTVLRIRVLMSFLR